MNFSDEELLTQISQRFVDLANQYGEPPLRTRKEIYANPELLHQDFNIYGYGVIDDVLNEVAWEQNEQGLIEELSLYLFQTVDPFVDETFLSEYQRIEKKYPNFTRNEKILATLSNWWNGTNGFGNASFRFVYFQFLVENPHFPIGSEDIEFSYNPIHRHSLRLLANHPELWEILKSFHQPGSYPMVSWDSQKIRFQDTGRPLSQVHKSTKPILTVPHRDIYLNDGVSIDRVQAMLITQDPQAIALGWVLFSHDPEIQRLSSILLHKQSVGFSTITDQRLIDIMAPYWRSPLKGFVIWKQETVHYEGEPTVDRRLEAFEQVPERLRLFSFRAVIGTHIPIGLSQEALIELGYLAEYGWCPEIYLKNKPHNRGTEVNMNVVNRKTTQYMIPRQLTVSEEASLTAIEATYSLETATEYINTLPKIMKEFYGLY